KLTNICWRLCSVTRASLYRYILRLPFNRTHVPTLLLGCSIEVVIPVTSLGRRRIWPREAVVCASKIEVCGSRHSENDGRYNECEMGERPGAVPGDCFFVLTILRRCSTFARTEPRPKKKHVSRF